MAKNTGLTRLLRRAPISLVLFSGFALVNVLEPAIAGEWRLEPILRAGVVSDDNANLSARSVDEIELDGYLLEGRADITYAQSDKTTFFLQPRAVVRSYPDEPDLESDDLFLRSRFRHRAESSTFGFRFNFDKQTVRTGERGDSDLEIDDPGEIPDDDTGRVGLVGDRYRLRVLPYWNYEFSKVSSIELAMNYLDTSYEDVIPGTLIDYTDTRINLSYRQSLSNTTKGILTVTGRRFEPDDVVLTPNDGFGILGGFERALSEKIRLVAMIGVENTDLTIGDPENNIIGNITLTRDLETIRMLARYMRAVTANGSGSVQLRDSIDVNFNRRLNERISAGLGVRAYHSEPIGDFSTLRERDYVQLHTRFRWFVSKTFVIEASYRYTALARDRRAVIGANEQRANSNEVAVWFVYQPNTTPKL
jgi:hypothetical protein